MAISYPMTIPVPFRSYTLQYQRVVGITQSPFSMRTKKISHDGGLWMLSLTFQPITTERDFDALDYARKLQNFMVALDGGLGNFRFGDPKFVTPKGTGGGSPKIREDGQKGTRALIKDAPPSLSTWLKAGDRIQIGDHYYMVMLDCPVDGGGNATIEIRPPLRQSYLTDTPIILDNPKGIYRLQTNNVSWTGGADKVYNHDTVQCIEDI